MLDVYKAKSVIVSKLFMATGYVVLERRLVLHEQGRMVFGDAKKVVEDMIKAVE